MMLFVGFLFPLVPVLSHFCSYDLYLIIILCIKFMVSNKKFYFGNLNAISSWLNSSIVLLLFLKRTVSNKAGRSLLIMFSSWKVEAEVIKQQEAKRGPASSKSEAQDKGINILCLR